MPRMALQQTAASTSVCTDCGSGDAPHLGELVTTRVGDGIVRDARVHRCTACQKNHRRAERAGEVS
jgi:hypothetical protein